MNQIYDPVTGAARLLTPAQKLAELNVSVRTLAAWRKAGKVRFIKYSGKAIRYWPETPVTLAPEPAPAEVPAANPPAAQADATTESK